LGHLWNFFKPSIVETDVLPAGSQHARWITDFTEQRDGLLARLANDRGVDEVEFNDAESSLRCY